MIRANIQKHTLIFKLPGGTSRGVLHQKNSWIISLFDDSDSKKKGKGEVSIIEHLSPEWNEKFEQHLSDLCLKLEIDAKADFSEYSNLPSLRFALESALLDLKNGGQGIYFPSAFTDGRAIIPINGLVWMGNPEFMKKQIDEKLANGFRCIKLKVGALDFQTELEIIKEIRGRYSHHEIEIRVDANGAFSTSDVMRKLESLAVYGIHSIEQPIFSGQWEEMKKLCEKTPIPIALDEELIGHQSFNEKREIISFIKPHYVVLKPSLVGGFASCDEWISLAEKNNSGWWITSALESNVGLSAIAQYTFTKGVTLPQGLGTGQVFTNNFESPLVAENGTLRMLRSYP